MLLKNVPFPLALLASGLLAGALHAQNADSTWAHDGSDIKADPAVTWGQLDNGLRYAILPNAEPPERISMRIYVDAGSLMETEEQRGLAHFIEHMAFNGTKNYPAGEMVEFFQRLGMAFGADTNAHTSYKETVYKLELPKPDPELLKKSFQLLRDYADGMLMSEEEIEKERGVILSEKLSRDSVQYRTMMAGLKFALPDSLISKRSPIGTTEVIKGAQQQTFLDFYRKWYAPERMAIVVVGDVKPPEMEAMIREYFASMKKSDTPVRDPDLGTVSPGRGVIAMLHTETEASATDVSIETMQVYERERDTKAKRLRDLRVSVANSVINRRLSILAKKEGAPFIGGQAYSHDFMDFVRYGGISMSCKPENWEETLKVGEKELRKAIVHGFTKSEIAEIKAHLLNAYEEAVKSAPTRKSRGLADSLASDLAEDLVFTHPSENLAIYKEIEPQVTAENCHEALKKLWDTTDIQLFVAGNLELRQARHRILAAYKASQSEPVEAPEEKETGQFAYTSFGEPGVAVEMKFHEDLEITQIRFSNNVRLNLKKTDFEKNTIRIGARIGGGLLEAPRDKPGLAQVTSTVFDLGGLEAHSVDDLRPILAGKTVGGSFSVTEDAFFFGGRTNSEDFLLQCQLMCAYITAPGYRGESLRLFRKNVEPLYTQLKHTPNGVFQNEVDPFLKGHDPRFGFPPKEKLLAITLDDVKAWLKEPLASAYLEIGVVGDFDQMAVIKAVGETFGALPKRAEKKPEYAGGRILSFPKAGTGKRFPYQSEIPKALSAVFWKTTDRSDISKARRLGVVGSVFADRLRVKVREELGETYSPYARHSPSDTFKDYGYLFAMLTIDPKQADKITEIVDSIGTSVYEKGITKDELDRALKPLLTSIDQQLRNNGYWLRTVVLPSQEEPKRLDWARTMRDDYASVTVEEVNALAKEYLKPGTSVKAVVVSEAPAKKEAGEEKKETVSEAPAS